MSDAIDNGGPAFAHGDPTHGGSSGMSLLDWFAGQALPPIFDSLIAAAQQGATMDGFDDNKIASMAYSLATAMIAEKRKREQGPQ